MRLVVEALSEDDEHEYLIWKWAPAEASTSEGTGA